MFSEALLDYANVHSTAEPEYLQALARETMLKTTQPIMLSGTQQGRFLSFISKMLKPKLILEIGTFTGYSALCLAEGLASNGKLITLELNDELQHIIDKYIAAANMQHCIEVRYGNALDLLPNINEKADLIFIDADKPNYINYYEQCLTMLQPNGIILVDNVFFHGQVLDEKSNKSGSAIKAFNDYVAKDDRVEVFMLPLRDGMSMIKKKK